MAGVESLTALLFSTFARTYTCSSCSQSNCTTVTQSGSNTPEPIVYIYVNFSVENETRCYGEIGCMNITREWYHLIHRPFNVFPLPRSVINTRFILYTEKNPIEGQLLQADDKEAIKKTNFNPKWLTKFIIHGFIDTPLSNWVSEMRDELIARKSLNVIVVDWAGGSLPLYTQVNRRSHPITMNAIWRDINVNRFIFNRQRQTRV